MLREGVSNVLTVSCAFGANQCIAVLQASDGEKSDQDLVVDDASEVT
jgi:hypothetical protein